MFQFETCLCGGFGQGIPSVRSETQSEFLDGGFGEAPAFEVVQAGAGQVALEELQGEVVEDEKAFFFLLGCQLFWCGLGILYFDVVLFGKPAQCFGKAVAFVLHEEFGGVPTLVAAKAFKGVADGRDAERRRFFVVEGAAGGEVGASSAEGEEVGDDFFDADGFQYLACFGWWNHIVKRLFVDGVG